MYVPSGLVVPHAAPSLFDGRTRAERTRGMERTDDC